MLGNAVGKHFLALPDYDVCLTYRNAQVAFGPADKRVGFDPLVDDFSLLPTDVDFIVNCIGIIKPFMAQSLINAITINSLFPRKLALWCKEHTIKLLHITTDCVYSGFKGSYVESDPHDALDDYGKSKSLGEPVEDCMVLRTSIIGEEIHKDASLIAWAKSQKGQNINGFTNHLWNGVTTNQYAKCCQQIIEQNLYEAGLFHVFAKDVVSKYDMMHIFNDVFNLGMTVNPFEANPPCDRSLATEKPLCMKLNVPSVREMVMALSDHAEQVR